MHPDYLIHYYEASGGPFQNLSDLPPEEAEAIQESIRKDGNRFASRRAADYLAVRRELEDRIRALFIARGGQPQRSRPYYMVLGRCPWIKSWYVDGREASIPLARFSAYAVSFTYGDSFPAMHVKDGRAYRGQVYTLADLPDLLRCYGLPQEWNAEGKLGPERYIEAQVWEDGPIRDFLRQRG